MSPSQIRRATCNRVLDSGCGKPPEAESERGADLVVFPECMLTGYAFDSREEAFGSALEVESEIFASIRQSAAEFKQAVVVGFVESDGKRLFNSAALIDSRGMVGCYRKIHLPHLGVDRFVDRGDREYQAFSAATKRDGPVSVGLAICYDASFPEPMRVLGLFPTSARRPATAR